VDSPAVLLKFNTGLFSFRAGLLGSRAGPLSFRAVLLSFRVVLLGNSRVVLGNPRGCARGFGGDLAGFLLHSLRLLTMLLTGPHQIMARPTICLF
jgi:hypothetical protein